MKQLLFYHRCRDNKNENGVYWSRSAALSRRIVEELLRQNDASFTVFARLSDVVVALTKERRKVTAIMSPKDCAPPPSRGPNRQFINRWSFRDSRCSRDRVTPSESTLRPSNQVEPAGVAKCHPEVEELLCLTQE
uniref:Uncharacterized protein n=1 Tax=Steinernema glaseri TaxID=37863 RepID=A0A1I7YV00_9BILA